MKRLFRSVGLVLAAALIAMVLPGCGAKSAEDKVKDQMALIHPLTAEERNLADANAKNYFQKEWLPAGNKRGQLINCKPSDSNNNGLVTCNGYVPTPAGTFTETVMFCGYRPELTGCSNTDTVK